MGDLEKLGKYQIQSVLGQGAMGIVYKGFDQVIERTVAIKAIRKDVFQPTEMEAVLERFKREAQAAGRLHHPGIVTVFDYGEEGDTAFIAMEYAEGRELQEFLDNKEKFPLNTAVDIVSQLLDVLIYSHSRGVVHRDIKPANVLLVGEGQIKVMDFGIAKIESSTLTQFGDVFGTPSYMSPEQYAGQPVDKRTDLYSTGVLLYHLLTGEKPFDGGSVTNIMHNVMTAEAPMVSGVNLKAPSSLDKIVQKALAKDPDQRYQTAEDFKADLTERSLIDDTLTADLSGKTNSELKKLCSAVGITGCSKKNKKELIDVLMDAGNNTAAIIKANLTVNGVSTGGQADVATVAEHGGQQEGYDKTVFEATGDGGKPETSFLKKVKKAMTILLVAIIAILGFIGWTVYEEDLNYQDVRQIVQKIREDPAAAGGQYLRIAKEQARTSAISLYDQLMAIAKDKWNDIQTSSSDQDKTSSKDKSKDVPVSTGK